MKFKNSRGQATVEFAFASFFFFAFIIVLSSLVNIFFQFIVIDFALSKASRTARNESSATITTQINTITDNIGVSLAPPDGQISIQPIGGTDFVTITVTKNITVNPFTAVLSDIVGVTYAGVYTLTVEKDFNTTIEITVD